MAATSVVSRADIRSWAEGSRELWLFRKGVEGMQAISQQSLMDERGYQYLAGVHGGFGNTAACQHGNANFVTWHRPYLLDFELKLRAAIAKVADQAAADEWRLPYWQWDDPDVDGLPEAFTVETYDDQGTERENPLLLAVRVALHDHRRAAAPRRDVARPEVARGAARVARRRRVGARLVAVP